MGIYLNPKNKGFWESLRSEIYVDKTGLISCTNRFLNTREKFICISRPRRFGKSMTLEMLAAYYSCGCDSAPLFAGLKIGDDETFAEHLNQYDVIFLNMQQFLSRAKGLGVTEYLEKVVVAEIRKTYGDLFSEYETNLATVLEQIYVETDRQFIFLIDEWDCVMREKKDEEELQRQYLDFLRNLLKDQPYVALAYMTGICSANSVIYTIRSLSWRRCAVGGFLITGHLRRHMRHLKSIWIWILTDSALISCGCLAVGVSG